MVDVNRKIDLLQRQIDQNERMQDKFIASHGYESLELYKQHDELCDKMEELCAERSRSA